MERPKTSHLIAVKRILSDAPISWCSKKEPVVALSSCEAEYIAASLSTCQAIWLKNLIEEISQDKCETVTLKVDNVSAIN
ncbi:cationic amino acid transporter 1-like, partial [Trifolium medium]|nr:cationic amino acid transporter 1-like [Trifolium medium]